MISAALLSRPNRRALFRYTAGDSLTALGATATRATTATYKDSGGTRQIASVNVARDAHYINGVRYLLLEGQRTNHFLQSATPATQTSASLTTGTYTLWMEGTGSIAVAGTTATITGAGSATNGSPKTFVVTVAGTVTYTVTGSPTLAQSEDGAFASSYIPTTTVAVTRSADVLSFPWLYAPQAATFYAKAVDLGTGQTSNARIFEISNATDSAPRWMLFKNGGLGQYQAFHDSGGGSKVSNGSVLPALNDLVEFRATLASDGTPGYGQTINGAAETVASGTAGVGLAAAWASTPALYIGQHPTGGTGFAAFQSIKVARGIQSLATMRGL